MILGGTCGGSGDVTAAAEFNIYCDPAAGDEVFRAPIAKTLLPLDITSQLLMTYDFLQQLPADRAGPAGCCANCSPLPTAAIINCWDWRASTCRRRWPWHCSCSPALFVTEEMSGDIETKGELTVGTTVFDRRRHRKGRTNVDVVTQFDATAVKDCIVRMLDQPAQRH